MTFEKKLYIELQNIIFLTLRVLVYQRKKKKNNSKIKKIKKPKKKTTNKNGKRSIRSLPRKLKQLRKEKVTMQKPRLPLRSKSDKQANEKFDENEVNIPHEWDDLYDQEVSEDDSLEHSRVKRTTSSKNETTRPSMVTSPGAGQQMGLSVVLNSEKNKYFMTSAFFEGFKVLENARTKKVFMS